MAGHGVDNDCLQVLRQIVERKESCDATRAEEDVQRIDMILRGCPSCCSPEYIFRCRELDEELRAKYSEAMWRFGDLPGVSGNYFNCGAVKALRQDRAVIVADTLVKHELVRLLERCLEA